MPCFNIFVETDAVKPRSILRGGAVSSAAIAREDLVTGLWSARRLTELTAGASTVACLGVPQGAVDDASVCGLLVPCVRALGLLVDLRMFIGFAV